MSHEHERYYNGISSLYARALEEYGDDPRSVFTPKGRQTLRYDHMLDGLTFDSVLDVGCGTGLLKAHLDTHGFGRARFTGVDIVEGMVTLCRRKFPDSRFVHVRRADEIAGTFDLVLTAGTFNIIPPDFSEESYKAFVFETLAQLYARADRYLVFDFLNDLVDFRQPRAFHLGHADVIAFVTSRLSRRFEMVQSYMPYEGAVRVFKDDRIDRASNVFAAKAGAGGGRAD